MTIILILIAFSFVTAQTILPDDFIEEVMPYTFDKPVGITFSPRGHGFVWEKEGKLWLIDQNGNRADTPLLDLSEEISSYGDHGLVSVALSPSFIGNGHIYLYYAVDRHHLISYGTSDYDPNLTIPNQASIGRITRYTLDQTTNFSTVIPNSRKIILGDKIENGLAILMTSHAVGSLVFGTDGSLLLSFGDGGSFTENDRGNANDTYHEQAIQDGLIREQDNVGSFRALQLNNPHGKILRINPETGSGLSSNPFYDASQPNAFISKVWAHGFRNPYKFMLLPETGSHEVEDGDPGVLLVGDVGSSNWEELNVVDRPGGFYGWPFWEGFNDKWGYWDTGVENPDAVNPLSCGEYFKFDDLILDENQSGEYTFVNPCNTSEEIPDDIHTLVHSRPILAYSSAEWNPPAKTRVPAFNVDGSASSYSITDAESQVEGSIIEGGSIIPSTINPYDSLGEEYKGLLFIADYHGFIFTLELKDDLSIDHLNPFLTTNSKGITDLAFHPISGELYYIHLISGQLRRVSFGGVLPPTIKTEIDHEYGPSPLDVTFDARATISHSGEDLSYEWDLGNGILKTGAVINHQFTEGDVKAIPVKLTVEDESGRRSQANYTISINNTPPIAKISSVADSSTYAMNGYSIIPLKANVSDAEHQTEDMSYEWRVDLYHDTHFHLGSIDRNSESVAIVDPLGCGLESYWYKVLLTVTDPAGLQSRDTVEIFPYCDSPFITFMDEKATALPGSLVQLDWKVDRLDKVRTFKIEHTDLFLFREVGEVQVTNFNSYSFVHQMPFTNKNFYRIKALDAEGNYLFSKTVEAQIITDINLKVFPNPTSNTVNIFLCNPELVSPFITIMDITGRRLKEYRFPANAILEETLDIKDLTTGIYIITIELGNQALQTKLLVY